MVTLLELDGEQIARIVSAVPGGAANIQDIYPLAPLQEGMLFHHLLQTEGDAYVGPLALSFDTKERLERFLDSLNRVIGRHDILRTAVLWEGLKEPVQVVQREARVKLQWLEAGEGDSAMAMGAAERLDAYVDPASYRIDVRQAPLIRAIAVQDPAQQRWLLQLPSHHLVLDQATARLLVEEIALVQQGREAELPEPVPFRRYVAQSRLGVSQAEHEAFFGQMLGDVDEPTAPFGVLDAQGLLQVREATLRLAPSLSQQVRREAQRLGVSAATLFHVAWALVLARTTGRDDVVFGTVLFGRMQGGEGAERALGMFINTLPLRVRLGARDMQECVRQTHQSLTQLLRHEHAKLSLVQRCSALPGGVPLFSALLNYRHSAQKKEDQAQAFAWAGMEVLSVREREHSTYPFCLSVDDLGEDFALVMQVNEAVDAQRMCEFVHAAIGGVVRALEQQRTQQQVQPVCELELLPAAEQAQLTAWGVNLRSEGDARPLHEMFEGHAQARPEAVALVFGEQSLSYGELNARANRLAHRLMALGVGPESRVGIALERSLEMVVVLLGILKSGGAYVPLDPQYPAERLAYMVQDSAIGMLVTHSSLRAHLEVPDQVQVLTIDTLDTQAESAVNPRVVLHGENLAYIIYTSGSTGWPKGVMVVHAAVSSGVLWLIDRCQLTRFDVALAKSSHSFDISVWEFFAPLLAGARLVIAAPHSQVDPIYLDSLVRKEQVTLMHFVPSMLQVSLDIPPSLQGSGLRQVFCGGEALSLELQKRFGELLPEAQLHNLYGPTEATIAVTHWQCSSTHDGGKLVPIGRPITNTRLYVLDAGLHRVPRGVTGELYIGGVGVARGYLGRAALTAERFIADPFDADGGGRLYRTGDLVRWNTEGQLEYLGRIDQQVKVRGFRIELGEVEAHLLAQPEVREAVVVANEGPAGVSLAGYVSVHAGMQVDTAVLRERLGGALPGYMVPAALTVLDSLPLNSNGKIDRRALPSPDFTQGQVYEAPRGEVEEALAQIWSEVLGVARVGRADNFFELGGHSLLALRVLERVRGRGWSMQVRTLFQQPQLAAFAQALMQEQGRVEVIVPLNGIPEGCQAIEPAMVTLLELDGEQIARIVSAVPGGAANIQDIYPLAPLQEGMLFHHLLQTEGDAYVGPLALSFDTKERLERFLDSLNRVIGRHDILRTAVLWEGLKEPVQVVQREARVKLQWLEAGEGDSAMAMGAAERLDAYVDPASYRIDVRQAPLIRAIAVQDPAQQRWLLQLPSHHLVLDQATARLLVEEIALVQQGREAELPEPVPFRRYVAQSRLGVSQAEHEAFFGQMLGDVDEPTAPFGVLDAQGLLQVREATLRLAPSLSQQVRREAQRLGVSAATLFHVAWALVLARTTGRDDVVFGTVLFGRMQGGEGAERALGMFINTLPLRVRLGARDMQECVRQTHQSLTQLLRHEHAKLSLVQRCSALPGGVPLFSALLNYRHSAQKKEDQAQAFAWAGMEVLSVREREHSTYPFCLSVDDLGEDFALVMQVNEAVDAQRMCEFVHAAIGGVVRALEQQRTQQQVQPVCELELLPAAEQAQLTAWGVNLRSEGDARPLHEMFEGHAQARPEAVALVFGEQSLSYGELNARANRLAHRLMALGVGPESRVGIALERSLEMVVVLLGILKSGGAYVPLDPQYPAERLAYMVQDSAIGMLVTHSSLRAHLEVPDQVQVLTIDTLDTQAESAVNPRVVLHGENLAYIIYTSGSTGWPKGVMVVHAAVSSGVLWLIDRCQLTRFDVALAKSSHSFDISVWEFFAPLLAGARLVIAAPHSQVDPIYLDSLVRKEQVTLMHFVPSMLQVSLDIPPSLQGSGLRQVFCGGEALSLELQKRFGELLPEAQLHNLYGPTEATIAVTHWQCSSTHDGGKLVPIGRPITNTRLYVLDAGLHRVPRGVTGELYIGGVGVARGYLGRAALTAERFIADPFDADGGGRLYRTGDLVRWNTEGQLEYLGRIDQQVKVRGFRIELGEVEAHLLAQPEVREAVVVANEGPAGVSLAGYVSVHAGMQVDTAVLRERLGGALPGYMVPAALTVLDSLPLNSNGKIDRRALPSPDFTQGQVYEAPRGEVEEALAQIWSEVLGVARVGRADNFFELGGHSLLAVQVTVRTRRHFDVTVSLRTVFEHRSLAEFAASVAVDLSAGAIAGEGSSADRIDALLAELEL